MAASKEGHCSYEMKSLAILSCQNIRKYLFKERHVKGASLDILDILGEIKYIIQVNFTCFFFFFNVATKNIEIIYVAGIIFLLGITVLEYSSHNE